MTTTLIAHFILSEFIWSISWGIHHQLFNTIAMALLLKLFSRMSTVQAVLSSCAIQACSFALLCGLALITMYTIGSDISPDNYCCVPNAMNAALYLGIMNAVFNSIFALIFMRSRPIKTSWVLTIVILSNAITVLILAFVFPPRL